MSRESFRSAVAAALAEVRRAQLKTRLAAERLRKYGSDEAVVSLLALHDILERVALRLETMNVIGHATAELVRSPIVMIQALSMLKAGAPPDVHYMITAVQEAVERVVALSQPEIRLREEELRREAAEIVKEALERARGGSSGSQNRL